MDMSMTLRMMIDRPHTYKQKLKQWTDSGDIVGMRGSIKRTEKGEMSVYVKVRK